MVEFASSIIFCQNFWGCWMVQHVSQTCDKLEEPGTILEKCGLEGWQGVDLWIPQSTQLAFQGDFCQPVPSTHL